MHGVLSTDFLLLSRFKDYTKAGSVYLAADTFLEPLYLAYGKTDKGNDIFYLYLGDRF